LLLMPNETSERAWQFQHSVDCDAPRQFAWNYGPTYRTSRLSSWLRFCINVGVPADINARISHLAECYSAALEHALAAARTTAGQQCATKELLRCEIPEKQPLERHQYRTQRIRELEEE
jgi:hypothetical protein